MCTVDVQQPIDISVILWTLLTIAEWQKWASFAETFKASFDGEMVDPPECIGTKALTRKQLSHQKI